jgi:hypothetical protein
MIIEDFEGSNPLSNWYSGGGTGASSALSLVTGHIGQGARLAYDLRATSPSEAYVWAYHSLDSPVFVSAVAFWVKSLPGISLRFQVTDDTGQTLQYSLVRPFGQTDASAWYRHIVKLDPSPEHWGGADDGVLHGAVHSVTVVVSDLWTAKSFGSIDFDEIALVNPLRVYLDPYALPTLPAPAGSGDLASRLAVNIHFPIWPLYAGDDSALDAARSAGFTWIRMDLPWAGVESSTGVYNFTPFDEVVASLQARGMSALFIIDQGNPLYTGDWQIPATTPSAIQAFGTFAEASARHYAGRPVRWEVWNEPNIPQFWPPAANANQYAALLQEAIAHLHQGNSSAKVSTAGLAGFDIPFLTSYLDTGSANAADAIGIHPYNVGRPELVSDYMLLMRSIVSQKVPANPPVWETEWGFTSAAFGNGHSPEARKRQAVLVVRELLSSWAMGFPLIVYYDIRDDGTDPNEVEHNYGLLANDYSEKPAMKAVRTLATAAQGRSLTGFVDLQPTSLHALRLDGTNDVLVVLWDDAPGGQVDVVVPLGTTGVNYLGIPLTFTPTSGELSLTVREVDGPVYLTFASQTSASFGDVLPGHWAYDFIYRLFRAGVTTGCSADPLLYCPDDSVTRAQMAIFLERGMRGSAFTPPAGSGTVFADVPLSYWAVNWIEKLFADGITAGCLSSPLSYCPEDPVTRSQMAVFLLRAKYGAAYIPPGVGSSTGFNDVPVTHWAAAWIKQLAADGITTSCGGGNYCPEDSVTRAQMAVFLVRTFSLP